MGKLNRREFAAVLTSGAVGALTGCDTDQKPSLTASILANGEIQAALKSLRDAIDNLDGDVGDFDTMNWREVVPRVTSGAEEVGSAFAALQKALKAA